jgi:hypothetical protein
MAANLVQHVADDVKKTRTGKVIDFTKRLLQRGAAKANANTAVASNAARAAASSN